MKLFLEIYLWAVENVETVRFFHLQTDITERQKDPDALMKDQLERLGMLHGEGGRYAHSTSWRYEDQRILLTYLIWVDGHELENLPAGRVVISSVTCPASCGPLSPRPESICGAHVLIHGLQHLRYLAIDKKDTFAANLLECQQTRDLLLSLEPACSGRLSSKQVTVMKKLRLAQ